MRRDPVELEAALAAAEKQNKGLEVLAKRYKVHIRYLSFFRFVAQQMIPVYGLSDDHDN